MRSASFVRRRALHDGGVELLLLGVTFECELDQAIDERGDR